MMLAVVVVLAACRPASLRPDYVSLGPVGLRTPAEQVAFATHALETMRADEADLLSRGKHQEPVCVAEHQERATALFEEASAVQASLERFVIVCDTARADAEVRRLVVGLAAMRTVVDEGKKCPITQFPPRLDKRDCVGCIEYPGRR